MEFLLLERRKNRIKYIPLKYFEFTAKSHEKESIKKSNQTALMNHQKQTKSVKR